MNVFAKVWHPCGAECLIQFDGQLHPFQGMPGFIAHLKKNGWIAENPSAASGPAVFRTEVSAVSRRATIQNGKTIDIIDFYSSAPNMKHKAATVYLDRAERIDPFVQLSGLRVEDIPMNPGQAAIQRGTPAEATFIKPCRPMIVVTEPNPNYDPKKAEAAKAPGSQPYKTSPRQFIRFEAIGQPQSEGPAKSVNPDRRIETSQKTGPLNGIITDPDFRKLLLAKGLTFYAAMLRIDKLKKTALAETAKTVADIPNDILAGFVNWLNGQPDIPARPVDDNQGSGIPF